MVESLKGCVESYLVPSVEEMLAICTIKFSFFFQLLRLHVMRSPEIVQTSPQSGMATVEEGQHVTLSCSAIGNPDPTITWRRKNGKRMKYINMKNGLTKKSKR